MGNIMISSDVLPKIDGSVKKMVNQGRWFLYKIDSSKYRDAEYMLIAEGESYFLKQNGAVVAYLPTRDPSIVTLGAVYFSDLPSPASLSNLVIA